MTPPTDAFREDLYTPLDEAIKELFQRQKNDVLKKKIELFFLSEPPPAIFLEAPRAVLAYALFSPIREVLTFLEIVKPLPIQPLFFECVKDKFVGINADKRHLGHMTFYQNRGSVFERVESRRIIDFAKWEGRALRDITTLSGEPLVEFHHRILSHFVADSFSRQDFSDWFLNSYRFQREIPYLRFLGLFLIHGILFENYLTNDKYEQFFAAARLMPAFKKIVEVFGVKPLIVRTRPADQESDRAWTWYPAEVMKYL